MASDNRLGWKRSVLSSNRAVRYMDGSVLVRDSRIPFYVWMVMLAAVVVAALVGMQAFNKVSDFILHGEEHKIAQIQANLDRDVDSTHPVMLNIVDKWDEDIYTVLDEAGYQYIDYSSEDEGLLLVGVSADQDLEGSKALIDSGIGNMNSLEASLYLPGYWQIKRVSSEYYDLRLRYTDLKSGSQQEAVDAAMAEQGFNDYEDITVTDEGVDSYGNTYKEGTFGTYWTTYTWRISACPLEDVYDIEHMPETASYVGIHITTDSW